MLKTLFNNKIKIVSFVVASTLLIPSNIGINFFGINFEDLPSIIVFIYLILMKVKSKIFNKTDTLFIVFLISFSVYVSIFSDKIDFFNQTNLRFIFYFTFSYLLIDFCKRESLIIVNIFEGLSIVMIINFLIIVFQLQLPGTIDGWVSSNNGSLNPFTSGRLGGIQGGGPNVIGIFCAVYALVCINKIINGNNSIRISDFKISDLLMLFISLLNLFFTYSRGSYLAFGIGFLILFLYSDIFSRKQKILLLTIGSMLSVFTVFIFSGIFLKQSNRTFLRSLAIENVEFFKGSGGGNYIKDVYKEYLITIDPQLLLEKYNFQYSEEDYLLMSNKDEVLVDAPAEGYLKLNFDYKDGFLPRSIVSFYYSLDGSEWFMIGDEHTNGTIIDLQINDSYFEVGGWGDGQSPGESYLDGFVESVNISSNGNLYNYEITETNRDSEYFVFLPKSSDLYDNRNDGKLIFSEKGLKLKRPRSYWVALPNYTNLSGSDFEVTVKLSLNNIPRGNETIFSQSSILRTSKRINNQSWKWSIVDGRMYFFWIEDVDFGYANFLGGQSLRSGKLIANDGKFDTKITNFSLSQYDEITTSHNGFLTMSVEYGLVVVILILLIIIYSIFNNLNQKESLYLSLFAALFTQNLTNDLIYSPDVSLYFWLIPAYFLLNLRSNQSV